MAGTYAKKDRESKKAKVKRDKADKKEQRKLNNNKGKSLDEMMAYVDIDGNLTSEPPDMRTPKETTRTNPGAALPVYDPEQMRSGSVVFFDDAKRYGFINDSKSGESIFVLGRNAAFKIKKGDHVSFYKERGSKGFIAVNVQLIPK